MVAKLIRFSFLTGFGDFFGSFYNSAAMGGVIV